MYAVINGDWGGTLASHVMTAGNFTN